MILSKPPFLVAAALSAVAACAGNCPASGEATWTPPAFATYRPGGHGLSLDLQVRFDQALEDVDGGVLRIAPALKGRLLLLRLYDRYLRNSEAGGNYQASCPHPAPLPVGEGTYCFATPFFPPLFFASPFFGGRLPASRSGQSADSVRAVFR